MCSWSNGTKFFSDKGFCAIREMTLDVDTIMSCNGVDKDACSGPCTWYPGVVNTTNYENSFGKPLFKWNFCHPPTTAAWTKNAQECL
jgi:hypothetical protein